MSDPRYKVYDKVWIMRGNVPAKMIVFAVIESMGYWKRGTEIHYRLVMSTVGAGWGNNEGLRVAGIDMFPTREALIKSLLLVEEG